MSGIKTLFTRIIEGSVPCSEVSSGNSWLAFLDINPRRDGHTLVVPHEQVSHISHLSPLQLSELWQGVVEVQRKLSIHFETTDFSIGIHDGVLAGQEIPHVHIHVIPRNIDDGGLTLLACWPNSPPIGSIEPDFPKLSLLADQLKNIEVL